MQNNPLNSVVITAFSAISKIHNPPTAETISPDCFNRFALPHFDFSTALPKNKNRRYLSRAASFAVAAATETIKIAQKEGKLPPSDLKEATIALGAGPFLETEEQEWENRQALWLLKHLPNTASSFIALTSDIQGESVTLTTACAASLQAIGYGFRLIKNGEASHCFAGGGDSRLNPNALNAYQQAGALYSRQDGGEGYAPLLSEPCGFIPGEGGAFFLMEDAQTALARGVTPLAQVLGFGASSDATSMTAPNPTGETQKKAILQALKSANLQPTDIKRISCHGTGTPLNDTMESQLLQELFNFTPEAIKRELTRPDRENAAIVTHKREVGHLSAACGAVELALELNRYENLPCGTTTGATLLQNFGFGGQNAVLIIAPWI